MFLLPTVEAIMLASWFYQSLPLLSFEPDFFLNYCVGDDLPCECHARPRGFIKCWTTLPAETLLKIILLGMLNNLFQIAGSKP